MQHLRRRQGDLFETGQRRAAAEIGSEDREKLLALLRELLTEALAGPTTRERGTSLTEAGDDQDHA